MLFKTQNEEMKGAAWRKSEWQRDPICIQSVVSIHTFMFEFQNPSHDLRSSGFCMGLISSGLVKMSLRGDVSFTLVAGMVISFSLSLLGDWSDLTGSEDFENHENQPGGSPDRPTDGAASEGPLRPVTSARGDRFWKDGTSAFSSVEMIGTSPELLFLEGSSTFVFVFSLVALDTSGRDRLELAA